MIGKWGFFLLPFYLGIIPIFANNNYTLTIAFDTVVTTVYKSLCTFGYSSADFRLYHA